jgi:hypothetical protein
MSLKPQLDEDGRRLLRAYLLGVTIVLVAALGSLLYMERATVKLSVEPRRLESDLTLTGGATGSDFNTRVFDNKVVETSKVATSALPLPATPAVGQVVFTCSPSCPGGATVPSGTVVATRDGVQYKTQGLTNIPSSGPSPSTTISAVIAGIAGNTDPDTVTVIVTSLPSNLHVNNPTAIAGGVEGRKAHVVEQSALDATRQTLSIKALADLAAQVQANAGALTYATAGSPVLVVASDYQAGDETPAFTVTVTGTVRAVAFASSDAEALLRTALENKVPAGFKLIDEPPVRATYTIEAVAPDGQVTITGSSVGYAVPNVSTHTLALQLRGTSLGEARNRIQHRMPNTVVDIRITPVTLPWLPMFADHISLDVSVLPIPLS